MKRRSGRWRSVALAAMCCIVLGSCVSLPDDAGGDQIYDQVCARCHGADLGGGVGPALGAGSEAVDRDDGFLTQTISRGRGRMPGFRTTLTEEQIQRVIEYLREQQGQ